MATPPGWLVGAGIVGSVGLVVYMIYEVTKSAQGNTSTMVTTTTTNPPVPSEPPAAQAEFPIIPNPTDPNYHTPQLVDGTVYILGGVVNLETTAAQVTTYLQANDWTDVANVTVGTAADMFGEIAPFGPLKNAGGNTAFFGQATYHTGAAIPAGLYAVSQLAYQTNQNAPAA